HFLPSDGKQASSSSVPKHSVALFRRALSLPIEVLDIAQQCTPENWMEECRLNSNLSELRASLGCWPVRLATLRGDFLADLISRYVGMYIRLGSRDFTEDTVSLYVSQIGS